MKTDIHLLSSSPICYHPAQFVIIQPNLLSSSPVLLRMKSVSDKSCRENQNTHCAFNIFFRKSCRLWENVEKYCTVGRATDGMAHEYCMLDTLG